MPLYDFSCRSCKFGMEKLQSFDKAVPNCPHCGQPMLRGVGNIVLVYWKLPPDPEPLMHNSHALSRAATKGWAMEAGLT